MAKPIALEIPKHQRILQRFVPDSHNSMEVILNSVDAVSESQHHCTQQESLMPFGGAGVRNCGCFARGEKGKIYFSSEM